MERRTVAERAYEWLRAHPFATDAVLAAAGVFWLVLVPAGGSVRRRLPFARDRLV